MRYSFDEKFSLASVESGALRYADLGLRGASVGPALGFNLAAAAGEDSIAVSAEPAGPVAAGGDLPADITTPASLALGDTFSDTLEIVGDRDWIAVDLVAGQRYAISVDGTGGSPLSDPFVRLYDAGGSFVAQNDDGGPGVNSLLSYTVEVTGTYYVEVAGWNDTVAGDYTVGLESAAALEAYSNDQVADFLASGYWTGNGVAPRAWSAGDGSAITVNLVDLTADGQTLARAALQLWSDLTGITFSEVGVGGQMVFDDDQSGAFASTTTSGGIVQSAAINISTAWIATYGTGLNTYSFQTYIHEIGHALGLGHAGPYNGSADYAVDAAYLNDSWQVSIMSYFSQTENTYVDASYAFVVSPQIGDVLAIQNMYGLAADIRSGNTVYGYNSTAGNAIYEATSFNTVTSYTIVDTAGKDTMDYSGSSANQTIDLREESYSSVQGGTGNVGIARGTVIEKAIGGSGNDTIIGNLADNTLIGRQGDDTINAGGGDDRVFGGGGVDSLFGEFGDDRMFGGAGDDTMSGGEGDDAIFGGDGADQLSGDAGRDDVRGGQGDDILSGGRGSDYLNGGAGNDYIDGGAGTIDRAYFSGNYADYEFYFDSGSGEMRLTDLRDGQPNGVDRLVGVELLEFADAVVTLGSDGTYALTGTSGDETLTGRGSFDTINAGAGDDRVFGGGGNDTINGEDGADRLFGEDGDDTIFGGGGVDALFGGDGADQLFGGAGRDDIRGGGGDDTLSGGSGSDDFRGGAGNDSIDGGSGDYDRAIYSGNYADYSLAYNSGAGQVQIASTRDGLSEGTDQLVSVEFLVFDDGVVAVNGGSFDFQPNLQPAGLPSAAEDGPAGQSFASLGVLSAVAKHGQSPVMDILDLSDDAGTFLTRADASGPGYVGDGWTVADPDAELLRAPDPGADWHLLSEAADAAPGDSSVVRLAVVPDVNPADWVTPVDAWEISANDGEARHEPADVSGWM